MRHGPLSLALVAAVVAASPLQAQIRVATRAAVFGETYSFDAGPGVQFSRISEITVPLGVTVPLGRFGDLHLSGGYVNVRLDSDSVADQTISGLLDTELRLSWNAIPGRLVVFANAGLPTGTKTITQEQLSLVAVVATDVIGFAASTVGSGGGVGGGFAGAVPLGRSWALGLGGGVRGPFSYQPIVGDTTSLQPGIDVRLRLGVEGSLARRTYLRAAAVFAHRSKDEVGGTTRNGVGNRFIGYLSLEQGVGNAALSLYAFDVYRANPQIEQTAVGAALIPRGNLLGAGAQFVLRLNRTMTLTPRVEFRLSSQAPDTSGTGATDDGLRLFGESLRFGADWRYTFDPQWSVVLQADGATGFIAPEVEHVGFWGGRAAIHVEWTP
jgi:hypothetical protein